MVVRIPATKTSSVERKGLRIYDVDGKKYPSVTSIIKTGIPKPALLPWAARTGAKFILENYPGQTLLPDTPLFDASVKLAEKSINTQRDFKASAGTTIHSLAQKISKGIDLGSYREDIAPQVGFFYAFVEQYKPVFDYTEALVVSERFGYAGTLDGILTLGNRQYIYDIKTGNWVYPEVALQMAAYSRADYLLVDGQRVDMPRLRKGLVLHLTVHGLVPRPVRIDEPVFDSFLAAYDIYNWVTSISKDVIGEAW